ncbi:hypothetical protein FKM82_018322 [Ascaphus truei]
MKKQLRRVKQQGQRQSERATAKNRVTKSAIEEFKKSRGKDHLQQNLKYMLSCQTVANKEVVKKVLKQNRGRRANDRQVKQRKKIVEKSVFLDADFKRFEKEYFGRR